MSFTSVRTRFAPSPTGFIHIGNARAALFAYLWAKKNNGTFVLRIEDTDQERYVAGSIEAIQQGLKWLGIEWDEGPDVGGEYGPYTQSERLDIYKKHVDQLLESNKAYRCFCTTERLEQMRKEQNEKKLPPRYDRTCRSLTAEQIEKHVKNNDPFTVRLAVPEKGSVEVQDVVHGTISFDVQNIDDQVLMKSDGFPTYHLANIVDDHLMEISHVIRGEEWIPSTPKHVLLYQAFGWDVPSFVHLTVFLSKNGGKMSKRDGDTALLSFRDTGYVSEAVVNFISLLGWNPKTTEEHFTLQELEKRFDLEMINKANPIFETDKLQWMNQHYIKQLSVQEFTERIERRTETEHEHTEAFKEFLSWFSTLTATQQESIWSSLRDRLTVLSDVQEINELLDSSAVVYDKEKIVWKKSTKKDTISILEALLEHIEGISEDSFLAAALEEDLIEWIKTTEWGNGDVLWPMRYAITGKEKSPSPFECGEIVGKAETITRLQQAKQQLES